MSIRLRKIAKKPAAKSRRMSDDAVAKATGKNWNEWFGLLDKAGAKSMNHRQIVAVLSKGHSVGPWWQQMVTVEYERARGLRKVHEKADGMFSVSRSKTVPVPIAMLYKAWAEPKAREEWLKEPKLTVKNATTNRSMRIAWADGSTDVVTMFYSKGAGKSQVTVEHNKLTSAKQGERMKKYWGQRLERMVKTLTA
jgi:hypothetical protein